MNKSLKKFFLFSLIPICLIFFLMLLFSCLSKSQNIYENSNVSYYNKHIQNFYKSLKLNKVLGVEYKDNIASYYAFNRNNQEYIYVTFPENKEGKNKNPLIYKKVINGYQEFEIIDKKVNKEKTKIIKSEEILSKLDLIKNSFKNLDLNNLKAVESINKTNFEYYLLDKNEKVDLKESPKLYIFEYSFSKDLQLYSISNNKYRISSIVGDYYKKILNNVVDKIK